MTDIVENFERLHSMGIQVIYQGVLYNKYKDVDSSWLSFGGEKPYSGWYAQGLAGDKCPEHIEIPEGVRNIGWGAFTDKDMHSVTFPKSLDSICNYAFEGCTKLKKVTLSEGISEICAHAFQNSSVEIINFPKTLKSVGTQAFNGTNIKAVDCSDIIIGSAAFRECPKLKSVRIRDWDYLGSNAFALCPQLETIDLAYTKVQQASRIPPTGLFAKCTMLRSAVLDPILQNFPEIYAGCENISHVEFRGEVTQIPPKAFKGCKALKEVWLPDSVCSIGEEAFDSHTVLHHRINKLRG